VSNKGTFGAVVSEYRHRRKMTLKNLSEITGIDQSTISLLESKGRNPRFITGLKLMRALNIPLSRLRRLKEI
jgi:transcriptional regulator with XRE-family HTH domain